MKRRIFVAVDISDEARGKVADYIKTLRGEFPSLRVGWEKTEKLHLTLRFLGETEENQLLNINETVEKIGKHISKFTLEVSETGVFPSARNARILWLDVKDETRSLTKINDFLETECEKIGFPKENRNYKSHLTIARLREPQKSRELAEKHVENEFEPVRFEVAEIVIYESRLQRTGSIYTKVSGFKFQVSS
jgi:2'-5' RNA ligase